MNIKTRLEKLEQRDAGFIISWAMHLDRDGQEIPCSDGMDEDAIQAIRFMTGADGEQTVDRLTDEPYADFTKRAHRDAAEELHVTFFAHSSTFKL